VKRFGLNRVNAAIIGATALFLIGGLLAAAGLLWQSRQIALEESGNQAVRFADSAVAALNRTVLAVDVMLASVDELLGLNAQSAAKIDTRAASRVMQGAVQQNLIVRYVALVDPQSNIIASSIEGEEKSPLKMPPGFIESVLAEASPLLIVSPATISVASSERVLYLARFIALADGTKVVAIAELQLPMLTALLLQGVNIAGLEVSVERGNGELLASAPPIAERGGLMLSTSLTDLQSAPTALNGQARLSGVPALVTARSILYGNIGLTASIPIESALTAWRTQRNLMGWASLLFGCMTIAAGSAGLWYVKRMGEARRIIAESKASLDQALESMVTGFLLLDSEGKVVSWNRRYVELFPFLQGQISAGKPFRALLTHVSTLLLPHAAEAEREAWIAQRVAKQNHTGSHEMQLPSGMIIQITERRTREGGFVNVYEDVTEIRAAAAEIKQLAFYDSLTKLPNRRLLNDRLNHALIASQRSGAYGALFFLDLDHFKSLNDTLGHDMGDLLLQQVAQRLLSCVRKEDTVARLGGDEFVVMLENLGPIAERAKEHTLLVGASIVATLNAPYQLGPHTHKSTPSVGGTLFGDNAADAIALLKQADLAMYNVKATGRNAFSFFETPTLPLTKAA
jgi:diguanylate cyclase (GGDEF)-like protein